MKLKSQDQIFFIFAVQGVSLMAVDQKNFYEKQFKRVHFCVLDDFQHFFCAMIFLTFYNNAYLQFI